MSLGSLEVFGLQFKKSYPKYFSNGSPPFFPGSPPLVCLECHSICIQLSWPPANSSNTPNTIAPFINTDPTMSSLVRSHDSLISQYSSLCFQHPQVLCGYPPHAILGLLFISRSLFQLFKPSCLLGMFPLPQLLFILSRKPPLHHEHTPTSPRDLPLCMSNTLHLFL